MKISDLAALLGKSEREVEDMLNKQDVIEINLTERGAKKEEDDLKINHL